ncbi:MAG: helix-turn-helix domain-containing protein [Clostridia bacterium]|nr:helix-turn-helix domain-containing protein [Clostridia bacterium]
MKDNFIKHELPSVICVDNIITVFYMELSKDFQYDGERHDFWEMVYIDKGEMLCTADNNRFTLKSGEVTFHKPNEYHNLSGNQSVPPNVSIVSFECHSEAMRHFEGKIIRLNAEERALMALLFEEGMACFRLADPENPLLQKLETLPDAPFGGRQMIKNLLEVLLVKLYRHKETMDKQNRLNVHINGMDVPIEVKEILDLLHEHVCDKLTVADIAKAMGKSETTVKTLFALYRPGGIIRYFNSLKIKEAKRMIRERKHNFAQIAELLGFDTAQYFSRCFKNFTHMTPSEYQRSILQ